MLNLILLHGALGHSDIFTPYLETLSQYFNIHTPVFSGHGDTELPANGTSIEKYTLELSDYCTKNKRWLP